MRLALITLLILLAGCSSVIPTVRPKSIATGGSPSSDLPATLGEQQSGYGYIPLDGLAIDQTLASDSCKEWKTDKAPTADPYRPLLQSLPDISVRYAVASFDASGGLTFGPAKVTVKGRNYKAVLDYVNVDTIPVTFRITALVGNDRIKLSQVRSKRAEVTGYEAVIQKKSGSPQALASDESSELVTIPVYVGVGLRLSADIKALEGDVELTSLGAIGLGAQAQKLTGTLTVQTLGVTGESIATSLPLPSKLDQTTIENGILAIGANRAVLYRNPTGDGNVITTPRVVGLYSPIGSEPALINAIYSELARQRPQWDRPCREIPQP